MSEDDEDQLDQEQKDQLGEGRLDWRELGQFAPRVAPVGRDRVVISVPVGRSCRTRSVPGGCGARNAGAVSRSCGRCWVLVRWSWSLRLVP